MIKNDWNSLEYRQYNKTVNKTLWVTILYLIIFQVATLYSTMFLFMGRLLTGHKDTLNDVLASSGIPYFVGVSLGLLVIYVFSTPKMRQSYFAPGIKTLDLKTLLFFSVLFLAIQAVFSIYTNVLEASLNMFGYSAIEQIKAATTNEETWSMLLYASLVAPISEEIIFRGFVLRSLQPYGPKLAIGVSAFLFGLMHANIIQTPFAFFAGLVLGCVAYNYGILWSMGLHLFNNFVLGNLLGNLGTILNVILSLLAVIFVLYYWFMNSEKLAFLNAKYKIKPGLVTRLICIPMILLVAFTLMQILGSLVVIH